MFQKSDRKAFWVPCKGHGACAQREQTGLISYRIYRISVTNTPPCMVVLYESRRGDYNTQRI